MNDWIKLNEHDKSRIDKWVLYDAAKQGISWLQWANGWACIYPDKTGQSPNDQLDFWKRAYVDEAVFAVE